MRKIKLYRFSFETLEFQEARWTRTRLLLTGLSLGAIVLAILLFINQEYNDILGIGIIQHNSLVNENRILQSQLQFLTRRLDGIQKQLAKLGEKSNELRMRVDLPKLDDDILKAGIGGVEERIDFTASSSVNSLINLIRSTTEKTERELDLQTKSYAEIGVTYEQNKIRFSHLPAIKPMEGFYNKYDFGMRFHPILQFNRPHEGIDIINEVGTPIYAPGDGVIDFIGHQVGYGLTIEIDHSYSIKTVYGHLSKSLVKEGQKVKRGDLIARSGNSGLSNGPHLHYEVRVNGVAQNPINYFFDDVKLSDLNN